jgi:LPS O-antigen subunit length determinant protein (WzzB/FepE family)
MNHAEQYEEISIFDYLNIMWKRKWFILIPALVLAAAAGILGFLKTPVSDPFRTAIQVSQQSLNKLIASELNLDRRRFPVLFAENLKNTWFLRTWLRVTDIDRGTKILNSLLQQLKVEFDRKLDMEVKRLETQIFEQENTIKNKRAEIVLLEIQKTKSLAQIASEEAKLKISEERL